MAPLRIELIVFIRLNATPGRFYGCRSYQSSQIPNTHHPMLNRKTTTHSMWRDLDAAFPADIHAIDPVARSEAAERSFFLPRMKRESLPAHFKDATIRALRARSSVVRAAGS